MMVQFGNSVGICETCGHPHTIKSTPGSGIYRALGSRAAEIPWSFWRRVSSSQQRTTVTNRIVAMPFMLIFLFVLTAVGISSKPVDQSNDVIDEGIHSSEQNGDQDTSAPPIVVATVTENDTGSSTLKPNLLSWFLTPLSQNLQFSPQSFIRDRIVQLKETLGNLNQAQGERGPDRGKQLGPGLLQVSGGNDGGFYTNRLEPAGFFGGNGWLANKGGIVGGPGAILSTGSILTDYPSPYRRK